MLGRSLLLWAVWCGFLAVPAQPQEYVEQGQTSAAPAASGQPGGTWYYCDDTRSYYPYVKSCSSGWRPVPAQQSQ